MDPSIPRRRLPRATRRPRTFLLLLLFALVLTSLSPVVATAAAGPGATSSSALVPLERDDCLGGGWRDYTLGFRNQGQCVSYVATNAKHFTPVKLLATNDFHGRLLPPDTMPGSERGGAAYLAGHLDAIRAQHPDALYVDAGDLVGATPVLSNLFYDEPTIEAMNLMGLAIQTVGNHEFDRGKDEVLRRAAGGCFGGDCSYREGREFAGSDFVTLSTNVIVDATGAPLTYPYDVIDVAGVDIGFIGVTTIDTPNVVSPAGIVGLTFLPEVAAINATVPKLQAAGADVIVVLLHEGGRQDGGANECTNFRGPAADIVSQLDDEVDVVLTGHTHQTYVCDLPTGPLVTQAMDYGRMFTEIDLVFDRRGGGSVAHRAATNRTVTHDVTPDPEIVELIAYYDQLSKPLREEIVGSSEVFLSGDRTLVRFQEAPLGNLATDALIHAYGEQFDVDFAFQNGGGLRANLTSLPFDQGEGVYPIRREDVLEVWPFANIVAIAEIDGPTLQAILANGVKEVGGGRFIHVAGLRIEYEFVSGSTREGRIVKVEYWKHRTQPDGTPVDLSPTARYTIATNDFLATGGDFYPTLTGYSMQDSLELVVERYLQEMSPVAPAVEGRIVRVAAP
jgi:5'-nucleotidase